MVVPAFVLGAPLWLVGCGSDGGAAGAVTELSLAGAPTAPGTPAAPGGEVEARVRFEVPTHFAGYDSEGE